MAIFGPDISSYEAGLDLSRLTAARFVLAKTTEGTYYTDPDYQGWRKQAASLGRLFGWYHFLSGEDAHQQVQHTIANVGDITLPGMLDAETEGRFVPTPAQVLAYIDAAHAAGLNLRLLYLPHWLWQQIGSPDLTQVAARGVHLVSSSYPGGSGTPSQIYPGDGSAGWQGYGGMVPLLYQFTNQASDGGRTMDYNAFRGTLGALEAALGIPASPTSGGIDVALTQQEITAVAVAAANEVFGRSIGRAGGGMSGNTNLAEVLAWSDQHVIDITAAVSGRPVVDTAALAASITSAVVAAVEPAIAQAVPPAQADVEKAIADAVAAHFKVV